MPTVRSPCQRCIPRADKFDRCGAEKPNLTVFSTFTRAFAQRMKAGSVETDRRAEKGGRLREPLLGGWKQEALKRIERGKQGALKRIGKGCGECGGLGNWESLGRKVKTKKGALQAGATKNPQATGRTLKEKQNWVHGSHQEPY